MHFIPQPYLKRRPAIPVDFAGEPVSLPAFTVSPATEKD
jgi:hypothetical protein